MLPHRSHRRQTHELRLEIILKGTWEGQLHSIIIHMQGLVPQVPMIGGLEPRRQFPLLSPGGFSVFHSPGDVASGVPVVVFRWASFSFVAVIAGTCQPVFARRNLA